MSPRRGWRIFGLGFYKDVTPMALGKSKSTVVFFLIAEAVAVPARVEAEVFLRQIRVFRISKPGLELVQNMLLTRL
jgi:hypothetical protein